MKQSPLHEPLKSLNAELTDQNGWPSPMRVGVPKKEVYAVKNHVGILDMSANGKIFVEGKHSGAYIQETFGLNAQDIEINAGLLADGYGVFRLRSDLFFIHTPPGMETELLKKLNSKQNKDQRESASKLISVTDMTHGRAEIALIGPNAAALLSRLCGLDFHETAFPNLTAKQSSVAKTGQIIFRQDLGDIPAFALVGDRSLAAYLWETAVQAGRDLGVTPIGLTTIRNLSST